LEVDDFSIGCTLNFVSQLCGYDGYDFPWSGIKCVIKICEIGYNCNLVNCSTYCS